LLHTKINRAVDSQKLINPFNIDKIDTSIQSIDSKKIVKLAKRLLEK